MPYYRRRYYQRRPRWNRYRRIRKNIWRRYWRTRRRTPYYLRGVRKRFNRKLKYIKLKQWQPQTIRNCKVIGLRPLFQGSPERMNNNYVQSIYSFVPPEEPGGGGWTLMIETLSSLWEDWEHLKNIWTSSNAGLPLVRFMGVYLTFFQSEYTDYIVQVDRCLPMIDTKYKHADSAPNRMLLKRNVIKVPSLQTRRKKRPFKKIFVPPPSQFTNKWYFQNEVCRIPLVMITAVSCDFRYPFCASSCASNNLTLRCLNIKFFQFHNFDQYPATVGYQPKPETYMYSTSGRDPDAKPTETTLIYLGDTKTNTPGTAKAKDDHKKPVNWGNPFWHHYIDGSVKVWTGTNAPTAEANTIISGLSEMTEPYFLTYRYNPERDKGDANRIYLVENFKNTGWLPPQNKNLIMEGFPLYDICWGYTDWQEKLHDIQNIDQHYMFVIQTDQFNEPLQAYVPIDPFFINGHGPYEAPLTNYDKAHWHPKQRFQTKSINDICLTGPGCCRSPYGNYVQAKFKYDFRFKWGGCPKTLEQPYDPCSQPNWTVPNNFQERLQITNPESKPQTELYDFDWRRDYVSQKAIKRIQKYTEPDKNLQIFAGSSLEPPILQQTQTSSSETEETSEEEQISIKDQILKLKRQQRKLKHRIRQRLTLQSIL
ncbi:ORF1 [Anelloviridae sp.]|nr:ORF1 [Anelloviridae sp.]